MHSAPARHLRRLPLQIALLLAPAALGCDGGDRSDATALARHSAAVGSSLGKQLFKKKGEFGTNGRSCESCHRQPLTGTLSPAEVEAAFLSKPPTAVPGSGDELFRIVDADDATNDGLVDGDANGNGIHDPGESFTYGRLRTHATIRVLKDLPANVDLVKPDGTVSPARHVVLNRAIPVMVNVAALEPALMYDGRFGTEGGARLTCTPPPAFPPRFPQNCTVSSDFDGDGLVESTTASPDDTIKKLATQAQGAVGAHFQPTATGTQSVPALTDARFLAIADFQMGEFAGAGTALLQSIASGGPRPTRLDDILPHSADPLAEAGRRHFLEPGLCGTCHGGPMLDTTPDEPFTAPGAPGPLFPPGTRFSNVLVSVLNRHPGQPPNSFNPVQKFRFKDAAGATVAEIETADPGLALVTGNRQHANLFRILSLWNLKDSAPYFHDNSARNFDDVIEHYRQFFTLTGLGVITDQDKAEMIAYLNVL